jgi:hypothetical protein
MNTYKAILTQYNNPNLEEELILYIKAWALEDVQKYIAKTYKEYHSVVTVCVIDATLD